MKTRDLTAIGIPAGPSAETAKQILQKAQTAKRNMRTVQDDLKRVAAAPATFVDDEMFGTLAKQLVDHAAAASTFRPRQADAPYQVWGTDLEPDAVQQMKNACKLPVAVSGALMPDAHVGYGLPIGGVLATKDAVIPYAVGVDIACRMKMTVLDLPVSALATISRACPGDRARDAVRHGRDVPIARQHDVMDRDWRVTAVTSKMKDRAWAQLGTSGSGNHFVEFGRADRHRRCRRPRARDVPRAAQPLRQPRDRRPGRAALQPSGAGAAPGASARAVASGVARSLDARPVRSTGRRWS